MVRTNLDASSGGKAAIFILNFSFAKSLLLHGCSISGPYFKKTIEGKVSSDIEDDGVLASGGSGEAMITDTVEVWKDGI